MLQLLVLLQLRPLLLDLVERFIQIDYRVFEVPFPTRLRRILEVHAQNVTNTNLIRTHRSKKLQRTAPLCLWSSTTAAA